MKQILYITIASKQTNQPTNKDENINFFGGGINHISNNNDKIAVK